MKKKLVILTEALGGGVRRHVLDLLMNLDVEKFEIYFLYGSNRVDSIMKDSLESIEERGINIIEIASFNNNIGFHDIKAFKNIYREIKKINPDIVHCHSSKAGALGRMVAKLQGIKVIYYTPHAYVFQNPDISPIKKNIYIKIEMFLNKLATTKTINVSKGEKFIAIENRLGSDDKFTVIYNGVNRDLKLDAYKLENIRKKLNIEDEDIVVGNIARADYQKNPEEYIEIARSVCNKQTNVKFIFVGDGELLEESRRTVKKYNLEDKIMFLGFSKDTDYILSLCNIFLTTSLYEGMPYSLIEASRAKLPIVATNVAGNNEIVVNKENGYLFNRKNIEDASSIIVNLIKNEDLLLEMRQKSYEVFEERFTLDKMIEKYEKLYSIEVI